MADDISLLKNLIHASASRQVSVTVARRAFPQAPAAVNGGHGLGGNPAVSVVTDQFATAYNGAVTVLPFMLDISLLDSDDVLTELV